MNPALEQSGGPWAEVEAAHRAWHAGASPFDYVDDQTDEFLAKAARRVARAEAKQAAAADDAADAEAAAAAAAPDAADAAADAADAADAAVASSAAQLTSRLAAVRGWLVELGDLLAHGVKGRFVWVDGPLVHAMEQASPTPTPGLTPYP